MAHGEDDDYGDDLREADKGELLAFMKDIEKESKSMMGDLMDLDNRLAALQSRIEFGRADKRDLVKEIESIRMRIGVLEKEDKRELNEEEVAQTLLAKLKRWVDQVV